jgi:hypothetical protein
MRGLPVALLFFLATCKPDKASGPTATQLQFRVQPQHTMAGSEFAPVRVVVRDDKGKDVTGFDDLITLSIGANPGGGTLDGTTTVRAVAGVATFSDLSIDKAGSGYRLMATAGSLPPATSSRFDITPGPATHIVITVEPTTSTAGSNISPAVRVAARDALENTADGFAGDITITMTPGTGSPGATLSGTTTVAATSGVAVFSGLSIDKAGTGYQLSVAAAATTVQGATSDAFDITPGSASLLVVTQQPTTITAGNPISPAVVVAVRDAWGNNVPDFVGNVTFVLTAGTGTPGAILLGTRVVAAAGGIATFNTLSVNRTGTAYTLSATGSGLATAISAPFDVTPGAVSQLVFTSPPTTSTAGEQIPSVQVAAHDSLGNTVPSFAAAVTIAIGANPGVGTLSGTTTVAAAGGVATFSTLSIDKSGTGYRLVASSGSLNRTSGTFNITPAAATQLAFATQPVTTRAGTAISPAVRVAVLDAFGNMATTFAGAVTVTLEANPGSGTLSGSTTVVAASGTTTFSTLSIDKIGSGYTLRAAASGLTPVTSSPFDITPATATQLAFTVQPGTTTAGATIAPAIQVTARDVFGNTATGFVGNVTVQITAGSGTAGATLAGTRVVGAVGGIANFSTLSIGKSGIDYTLTATASGLVGTVSAAFTIFPGTPTQLAFTVPPGNAIAGASLAPAVQVGARDAFGNLVTSFTGAVAVAITPGAGTPGATLAGTTTGTADLGVAAFSTLSIDKSGTGYTLTATTAGLTAAVSSAFAIVAGPASQLSFTAQPTNTTAGASISPAVRVTAQDVFGNTAATFTGIVTISLDAHPAGGVLSGTASVAATSGVAVFSTLRIDKTGSGYTLAAGAAGVSGATSAAFDIAPGSPTMLVFTVQPTAVIADDPITPAVVVTARDALGNTAISYSGNVTVELAAGTGTPGANLLGTRTVAAVGGIATFATLSVNRSGSAYVLSARASGLIGANSLPFDVVAGAVTQLAFTAQPITTAAGVTLPAVQVTAQDSLGNTVLGFADAVTLTIGTNPGGGTLAGTTTVTAVGGVATFSSLSIDKSGTGYRLAATSGILTRTSGAFSITPGPATQLSFTVQPGTTAAGGAITPAVRVVALDALGNTATGFTGTVTIAISTNPAAGTLSGTTTVAATAGVAVFSTLSIDKAGSGYSLQGTALGLAPATSAAFTISPAPASLLFFTVQPTAAIAGDPISPAVVVTARDAFGNTATGFTSNVTVDLTAGTGTAGANLRGTRTVAAVAGVATFPTINVNRVGIGYTLTAKATGVPDATTNPFDVAAGAVAQLVFTAQPVTSTAGATLPPVQIAAHDSLDNPVLDFTEVVTLTIGTNPGGGILSGTTAVAAVAGVATFSTLSIDKSGTGYRLLAEAGSLSRTSGAFSITPSAVPTQISFNVQPRTSPAGVVIAPAVRVAALDAFGNIATSFTGTVTIAIGTNPAGGTLSGTQTVAAVSGVAVFSTLSIDKLGTGYTLRATATGFADVTSAAFNIVTAVATQLGFIAPPVTTTAGGTLPPVRVAAQDSLGNTIADFTDAVTLTIETNPSGGTLAGTTTVTPVGGVATFSTLTIDKSGTGYRLAATSGILTRTSGAFSITPGPATQLSFSVQPGTTTAGAAITPAVRVTALDALGNIATGFAGTVTIAIGSNPAAGTLAGTRAVAAVGGVAVFSSLSIDRAGSGYTLQATAPALPGTTSAAFDIIAGSATQLAFTVHPSTAIAGATFTPAIQVNARDAFGNSATSFLGNVTLAITAGTGSPGAALNGTRTVGAVGGIATFSTLSINKSGTDYTLTATASGLTGVISAPFTITPSTVTQLVFTAQPVTSTAGATLPPVQVTAQDSLGNTVPGFTDAVTMTIGTNPGGGTLSGTTTATAVGGVATFSTLSIDKSGTGYRLAATSGSLTRTSGAFSITSGEATQLRFTVQPVSTTAGATITPALRVAAQDDFGNTVTSFTGTVAITIGNNPAGAPLSGTTTLAAAGGVAVFSNLRIDRAGIGYTLAATSPGLTGTTSAAFDIVTAPISQLAFIAQPVTTTAGVTLQAVQVAAQDSLGNTVADFADAVTMTIGTNPGGGALSGTTTVTAVGGVATFSTLSIDKSGVGYRLAATSGSLTRTSGAFSITPGLATRLAVTVSPSTTTAGATISPAVRVAAIDDFGNTATGFGGTVTIAIGANPAAGTLSGTTTVAANAGVAVFSSLSIDKAGIGYTLQGTAPGLAPATSAAFDITAGLVTQLAFTVQPSTATAGATITPVIQVSGRDALGNTVSSFLGNVTVAITAGTGAPGAALTGTRTVGAVGGIATFSSLSINKSGTDYTLTATASGLTGIVSTPFTITPSTVTQLVFTAQPVTSTAGVTLQPVQVTAQDSLGNIVPDFTDAVTLTIGTNPGSGSLFGTTTVAAVGGVATFSTLSIDKSGTGYRLAATSGSLTRTSGAFSITPGLATILAFTVSPSTTTAGATISPAVRVAAQDDFGNAVTSFTGTVTITIGNNPAGGVLSGTKVIAATAGVAAFSTLRIDRAGTGYTLAATSPGLTGTTSAAFDVVTAPVTQLAFIAQPVTTTAGVTLPAVQVAAQDSLGNVVADFTDVVTLTIGTNPGGGTLSGTTTVAAVGGVATFSTLSIDKSGTGYRLAATSGSLTRTSGAFSITAAAATQLSFTVQPGTTTAGATITPSVRVAALDDFGNTATSFTGPVTITIGSNPAAGTLSGTTTVAATAGVAVFSTLRIDKAGSGYTLAAAAAVTGTTSAAFQITPGTATQLAFIVPQSTATAGATITPPIQVAALDAFGNTATSFLSNITVVLTGGTGTPGATLSGARTVGAVAGIATFSTLSIDKSGTGYTLTATASGLTGTVSPALTITSGSAIELLFTVPPTNAIAGASIAPPVQVTARDALGNPVTSFTGDVTVALSTNPGAALSGTTTVSAVAGVATFSTLSIDKSGIGYKLAASADGLSPDTSANFTIAAGPATHLSFTVSPTTTSAGETMNPAVRVTALDGLGNVATNFTGNVTVAIGTNPAGGTLSGTTTVAAVGGVAVFSTLRIDNVGANYTLSATAAGVTDAISAAFDVTPGSTELLVFTVQPAAAIAGDPITPAVVVTAHDALGNTVTSFTGNVTVELSVGTGTPGANLLGTRTVAAVAGVATFSTLSINRSGTSYTLFARASGLTGATSVPFDVAPGAVTQLAFTAPPTTTTAGETLTPVQVAAQDSLGNTVPTFTDDVTLTIGTNPGGGTLAGTTTVPTVGGVATFSTLSIDKSGTGYRLLASSGSLTRTSSAFSITAGTATRLSFSVPPITTSAGTIFSPAVRVVGLDDFGNTATTFTGAVTIAIGTNPAGGTLAGTQTVTAVSGVAVFSNLSIDRVGTGYTLQATATGLTAVTSAPFDIVTAIVTQLSFIAQPITTSAGVTLPPVQVAAQDALGNTVVDFTDAVTLTISTNPGGGTLAGTTTVAAVGGIATFSTLSIDKSGTGYRLAATSGTQTRTSSAFSITPGLATRLAFTVSPATATAGATLNPALRVVAQDDLGNTVTGFTGSVTIAIGNNPAGGTLGGTQTVAAVSGVAVFSNLSIDKSGSGYTLQATAPTLAPATSPAFDITAGPATQLVFTVQPSATTAGSAITPAIQVNARDALGNIATSFLSNITVAITGGTGTPGAALSGTRTVGAAGGIATFSTLSIDKSGTGYTLTATASGLTGVISAPFAINAGPVTQLVFTAQPVTSTAGTTLPPVQIAARDSLGNTVADFTDAVTLTIGTNPGGGTLSGTTTVAAVAGVANFSTLSIDKSGTGYRLAATAGSLTRTSGAFSITPGTATQLGFTVQPATTTAGAVITPSVRVAGLDAFGNTATSFTGTITIAIGNNPGAGVLAGTKVITATAGVAVFSNLRIDRAGSGYTLAATADGFTGVTSAAFDIVTAAVTQLGFTTQPITTTAGVTLPAVQVAAQDSVGNTVSSFTDAISLTISTNPGGGTLSGTTTVAAVGGVATFSTLSIDKSGTGYRLGATSGSLTRTSGAFSITAAPATRLAVTVSPLTTTAGATISPAVRVAAIDDFGNTATGFTGLVTIAIGTNPAAGTLSGTTTVAAVNGVAVFSTLSIDKAGSGYTLLGTAAGLTSATSAAFDIIAGSVTQLAFTVQPSTTTAGATITPAIQVSARDAFGNTATSFLGNVTVAITAGTGTPGAALTGTRTVGAAGGIATFSTLSINKSGTDYTLTATASGLTGIVSTPFTITPSAVTQLVFTAQPVTSTAGVTLPPVQVAAQDSLGNTVPSFTSAVTLTIGTNPGGGNLIGTTTVTAVAGVATFSTLSIDKSGVGYRLAATSGSLTRTSGAFSITPGDATQLSFTVQPATATAGATISPAVRVTAQDDFGNTATNFTSAVTIAISSNPAGGTLSGTQTVAAVNGVAVFSTLSIDKAGSGYTFQVTSPGVGAATSGGFDINASSATMLEFTAQPSTEAAGAPITPAIRVTARDAFGNTATGFLNNVTVAITGGTGTPGAVLSGTRTVGAVAGVATFSTLSIDKSGAGYTLTATASGLTGAISTAFTINPGPASRLGFTVQPSNMAAGATITPAVRVAAQDAFGNTVTNFNTNVTVAIAVNPGGGTLAGTKTVATSAGVATFSTLSIDKSGVGYRLAATASGLAPDTSAAFSIAAGAATRLAFAVQPTATIAGDVISPAVRVTAQDNFGNTAPGFGGTITMAIANNPSGGVLSGTTSVAAVGGVANFSNLSINKSGTGYTLRATASGLTQTTSSAFNITASSATQLVFTAQPTSEAAGAPITPAIQVTARDAFGNTATSFLNNITVAITGGTGTPGAVLSGTRTVGAVAGVATFSTLSIDKSGSGYTLTATASGLTGAVSTAFTINPATATRLLFTVEPTTMTAGATITPAVRVAAQDNFGNTVTGFTSNVTVAIAVNPGGGTLGGTKTVAASAGVATFSTLSIDKSGTGYRLAATATGLAPDTSAAFSILAGTATRLAFTVQPASVIAGAAISPAVRVAAQDNLGNTVPGFGGTITMAIATNPSGGVLSGTISVAAVSGVSVFSNLRIDQPGTGYTLHATATGLTLATSNAFNVTLTAAPVTPATSLPNQ